jgi:hypothetical protein
MMPYSAAGRFSGASGNNDERGKQKGGPKSRPCFAVTIRDSVSV